MTLYQKSCRTRGNSTGGGCCVTPFFSFRVPEEWTNFPCFWMHFALVRGAEKKSTLEKNGSDHDPGKRTRGHDTLMMAADLESCISEHFRAPEKKSVGAQSRNSWLDWDGGQVGKSWCRLRCEWHEKLQRAHFCTFGRHQWEWRRWYHTSSSSSSFARTVKVFCTSFWFCRGVNDLEWKLLETIFSVTRGIFLTHRFSALNQYLTSG